MTRDRRFKHRVRRRMRTTGETYAVALHAERETRPPPRGASGEPQPHEPKESTTMTTNQADTVTRMRGIWLGVTDWDRTREFYESIGADFNGPNDDGIAYATLGGTRLVFEQGGGNPSPRGGWYPLFDVQDADALHAQLAAAGRTIAQEPRNEPWGRQFDVLDPDGYPLAFIGPAR